MTPEADNQRCRQDLLGSLECDLALKRRFTAQLAEFLSATEREVESRLNSELKDPGESVAEAWLVSNPRTPGEITQFYQETESYIFDLASDHCCSRRAFVWNPVVTRIDRRGPRQDVLLYGDGIGTDSIALARLGHRATYFDLPGRTSDFARFRFASEGLEDSITVITNPSKIPAGRFDAVVCIEVLEHVPDPTGTMRNLYAALKSGGIALITESFESIGPAYPSHLPENLKYAGKTHRLMERVGFANTYYNSEPINRPMEFIKKDPGLAADLLRLRGRLQRAVRTRWRYITHSAKGSES